jgi:hypothetical protein
MKTSPNGAPVCTGAGVAAVRKRIEDAFANVRTDVRTKSDQPEIEIIEPEPAPQKTARPLSERAAPVLEAAARSHQHMIVERHGTHRSAVYHVGEIRETHEDLIKQALAALGGKR